MGDWYDKKTLGTGLILAVILVGAFVAIYYGPAIMQYFSAAPPPGSISNTYVYTQGLTADFKIIAAGSAYVLEGGDAAVDFFASGANPFGALSTDVPVQVGSTTGAGTTDWTVVLDAGSYQMLVVPSAFDYPSLATETVPGTNATTQIVNLNPYLTTVIARATPSVSATIYAYDNITYLYDIGPSANMNSSYGGPYSATKWQITYTITVPGPYGEIKAGYIFLPIYTGINIASATFDNAAVSVTADSTGALTGIAGYFISYPDLLPGTTNTLTVNVVLGAHAGGSYPITLYEFAACANPTLRWWTNDVQTLTVV